MAATGCITTRSFTRTTGLLSLLLLALLLVSAPVASAAEADCKDNGYSCTPGYTGGNAAGQWAWQYYGANWATTPTGYHNCTLYVAWRLGQNGLVDPRRSWGNAAGWAASIGGGNHTPAVGAVAWWGTERANGYGHVAYVEQVSGGNVLVRADSWVSNGGYTSAGWIPASSVDLFLHPHDVASSPAPTAGAYAGHVVQWNGDTKTPRTAWYVTPDSKRLWIPDGGTYNCLKSRGAAGPDVLPGNVLDGLTDQSGKWAACGDTLPTNRVLRRNMSLKSGNGRYTLWLQGDGNLVLYGPSGRPLWANSRSNSQFAIMQGDGNLVTYTDSSVPTWGSSTTGTGGNRLVVQNDGNLVIYSPSRAVWASNTTGRT